MEILLATRNDHKVREIHAILADSDIELRDLRDFPDLPELPETGETFVDNALEKARFAYEH
jgi:XTP/dITP diphosphohydrolase